MLKKLVPPTIVAELAQTGAIAADKALFGEKATLENLLTGHRLTDFLMLAGAFLGEHLVANKEKAGLKPHNWFTDKLWHGSIVTQFAAATASLGRIISDAQEVITHSSHNLQFFAGDFICSLGGIMALTDNFRPRPENQNDLRNMIFPTWEMAAGIIGFLMVPVEDKPKFAGLCVATIANFVEHACEIKPSISRN